MKKLLPLFIFFVLLLAGAVEVQAEVIKDFDVSYTVNQDGTVDVKETIVYDFESEERRGIFRILKNTHPQPATAWYKSREVVTQVEGVTKDTSSEPFVVTESGSELEIRIGDSDVYLTGEHTYEISYTLIGALSSGPEGAEFYWNVTGADWPVTINQVGVVVNSDREGVIAEQAACYVGDTGSQEACLSIEKNNFNVLFEAATLAPGEQLTIAVELDPAQVAIVSFEETSYLPFGFGLLALWSLYFAWRLYTYLISERLNLPIIAQYEPYGEYLPMFTGVLMDGKLDPHDITAGIMYLAEQGFLKIKRIETKKLWIFDTVDYEITLLRPIAEIPTEYLKTLSGLLFKKEAPVGKSVTLSDLEDNRTQNSVLLIKLQKNLLKELKVTGVFTDALPKWTLTQTIVAITVVVIFGWFLFVPDGVVVTVLAVMETFIIGLIGLISFNNRRTKKGYEIKNHLEGFKLFLSVTDKERFDFHNAPEKNPELFMKYLPYAVALGVEEKWAKVFAGITIPQPEWYDGGGVATFSAAALTSDLSNFSTSFATSSGTTGSSGGGSAGGGGGGGGGGSW